MKKISLILAGALCLYPSFAHADDDVIAEDITLDQQAVNEADVDQAIKELAADDASVENIIKEAEAIQAGTSSTVEAKAVIPAQEPLAQEPEKASPKKKKSFWDNILSVFKVKEEKSRTCEAAFSEMVKQETTSIDFSNTTDFAQNGDKFMTEYYKKLKETNSFGTHSQNLYINLSNINNPEAIIAFAKKWSDVCDKDGKTVLWNVSGNKDLGDGIADAINLAKVYSLNFANTSVTDITITKIASVLDIQSAGNLVCVDLSGTKVSKEGVATLKAAFQKAKVEREIKTPGKYCHLAGEDHSGVIYDEVPAIFKPKAKKARKAKANLNIAPVVPVVEAPSVEETIAEVPDVDVPEANVSEDVSQDLEIAQVTEEVSAAVEASVVEDGAESESAAVVAEPSEPAIDIPENTDDQIKEVLEEANNLIAQAEQEVATGNASQEAPAEEVDLADIAEAVS